MKNKILSIIVCIAMLLTSLSMFAFAEDVEIDLSDLFGPSAEEPDAGDDDGKDDGKQPDADTGKDDGKQPEDDKDDGKDEDKDEDKGNKPSTRPSRPSTGGSSNDDDDDDEKADEKVEEKEEPKEDEPKEDEPKEWVNPFSDVKDGIWYYDTVKYVTENGIMNGVEDGKFAPDNTLTRAMLVTILYRAEGSPEVTADSKFGDVKNADWYGAPVIWAAENGIVNGVTETEFAPNNNITREQIATIIYRYAKNFKKYDVSVGENTNILSYGDFDKISSYAIEALQYTAGSGIMKGKTESTLNPLDNATRAEAATVVMRFIEGNK